MQIRGGARRGIDALHEFCRAPRHLASSRSNERLHRHSRKIVEGRVGSAIHAERRPAGRPERYRLGEVGARSHIASLAD